MQDMSYIRAQGCTDKLCAGTLCVPAENPKKITQKGMMKMFSQEDFTLTMESSFASGQEAGKEELAAQIIGIIDGQVKEGKDATEVLAVVRRIARQAMGYEG